MPELTKTDLVEIDHSTNTLMSLLWLPELRDRISKIVGSESTDPEMVSKKKQIRQILEQQKQLVIYTPSSTLNAFEAQEAIESL